MSARQWGNQDWRNVSDIDCAQFYLLLPSREVQLLQDYITFPTSEPGATCFVLRISSSCIVCLLRWQFFFKIFTGLYEQTLIGERHTLRLMFSFHDGTFHQVDTFGVRNLSHNICLRLTQEYIFLYVLPSGFRSNGMIKVQQVLYDSDPFITVKGYNSFIRSIWSFQKTFE